MLAVIYFFSLYFPTSTTDMAFQVKSYVGVIHLNVSHEAQYSGKDKNRGF